MTRTHKAACVAVAGSAVILLIWSIALFWFRFPSLTRAALESNAIALIVIWAIGPAVWFAAEWKVWRSEPGLAAGQQYARDFWIGAGAIVLLLTAREIGSSPPTALREQTIAWNLIVEVIRIVAWPLLIAAGLVSFRRPLSSFLQALGSRASKIGALGVSVELSALPEERAWSGPGLDDLAAEHPMAATDSSGSLFRAIAETASADYVTVSLGDGQAWLTSRLFILATLIPRVRSIKRIVFLVNPAEEFLGHASTVAVSEALARRYSWLADAYIEAHVSCDADKLQFRTPLFGSLDPQRAGFIMTRYLENVKGTTPDSVKFSNYSEHAAWITPALLKLDLGRALDIAVVKRDPAVEGVSLAKTLLRNESAYVAVLDSSSRFSQLFDRARALDDVVRRALG